MKNSSAQRISIKKHQVAELLWVVGGVAITALGTLVGVRVLTEFVEPAVYGMASLALGLGTLAVNLVGTPLAQAGMHFYPGLAAKSELPNLREAIVSILRQAGRWLLPAFMVLLVGIWVLRPDWALPAIALAALIVCDCWRTVQLSMLNAARSQRRYAAWTSIDTWLRPLLATAAIVCIEQSATAILIAYVGVSIAGTLIFQTQWHGGTDRVRSHNDPELMALVRTIWRYALPLMPLAVLGWAMNIGDRYIIGAFLTPASVGIYAAIYGLSSSPITLIGGTIELAVRPAYQQSVSAGNNHRAKQLFFLWLAAVTVGCGLVEMAVILWHDDIARLFLGPAFRSEARLIPWIAGGYALRCVAYVFERACYAYGQTQHVLHIQLIAGVAALIATPMGIYSNGLLGAAIAVPVYFSVQLIASIMFSAKVLWPQDRAP